MNCDEALLALHDELDGTLPAAERDRLATHLASCPGCTALAGDLRALTLAARRLPLEIAPSRDLWPRIAAQLDEQSPPTELRSPPGVPAERRPTPAPLHFDRARTGDGSTTRTPNRWWPMLAAAGLAGATVASLLTWTLLRGSWPGGSATTTTAAAEVADDVADHRAAAAGTATSDQPDARAGGTLDRTGLATLAAGTTALDRGAVDRVSLDRAYGLATGQLERLYARHADDLAPETRAAFDRSLAAIDTALDELRRALAADPASGPLLRELDRLQRHRLDLLERAATLGAST